MPFQKQETDWINKEKRELFCKFINSVLMTDIEKLGELDYLMERAGQVIDKAFKLYPDNPKPDSISGIEYEKEEQPF